MPHNHNHSILGIKRNCHDYTDKNLKAIEFNYPKRQKIKRSKQKWQLLLTTHCCWFEWTKNLYFFLRVSNNFEIHIWIFDLNCVNGCIDQKAKQTTMRDKEVDGEREQDVVRINSVTCLIFGWFALTFGCLFIRSIVDASIIIIIQNRRKSLKTRIVIILTQFVVFCIHSAH